jgi:hypothetical protein
MERAFVGSQYSDLSTYGKAILLVGSVDAVDNVVAPKLNANAFAVALAHELVVFAAS